MNDVSPLLTVCGVLCIGPALLFFSGLFVGKYLEKNGSPVSVQVRKRQQSKPVELNRAPRQSVLKARGSEFVSRTVDPNVE